MRVQLLVAALTLGGCGLVYTSPDVYETGEVAGLADSAAEDVQVIPLTLETALEANLAEYVPARLPDSFRPLPSRTPPSIGGVSSAVPDLEEPDFSSIDDFETGDDALPPAATSLQPPALAQTVKLPPEQEPEPYRIGVADVLLLSTNTAGATLEDVPSLLNAQSSRQGYIVQDDGAIAIPDVGRVRVAGLTMEEAEAEIFQALVGQRLDPSFSLEIREFNSKRVSIGGAVAQPQVVPITLKPLLLTEAIQIAGGVEGAENEYAVVRLFRNGEVFQAPLQRLYGDTGLRDVLLQEGDSIFIDADYDITQARAYFEEQLRLRQAQLAEREFQFRQQQARLDETRLAIARANFATQRIQLQQQLDQMRISAAQFEVARNTDRRNADAEQREAFRERLELGAVRRDYAYVAGEVRQPSRHALPFEARATLADMLFEKSGLNIQLADYSEIYVIRRFAPDLMGGITAYHLNASNAANLSTAAMFEMRPNDVVFVAEQPVTVWNRVISQLTPNLLSQGATLANATGN